MLCPLINYMSTVILYMYICYLIAYKMLLEKRQHSPKKELEVSFHVYITTRQLIGSDTLPIHRAYTESTHNTLGVR